MTERPPLSPVVFMDIDGVLVTDWSLAAATESLDALTTYEPYAPACVDALNRIIKALDPKIIIHSSRRFQYSRSEFVEIWKRCGIVECRLSVLQTYGQDAGEWFDGPNEEKVYDIQAYCEEHGIGNRGYAVLEDEELEIDNLLLVDGAVGVSADDAERLIRRLQ